MTLRRDWIQSFLDAPTYKSAQASKLAQIGDSSSSNESHRAERGCNAKRVRRLCATLISMRKTKISHQIPEPTTEELARIDKLLRRVGGQSVSWGAQDSLAVWVTEQRARIDQQMSERIRTATWVLVAATAGLVVCTAGLIWATLAA